MAPVKKPGSQAAGLNLVVTAASLALTLGGWGLMTANEMEAAAPPEPTPVVQPTAAALSLAPLPTLVPLRELPPIIIRRQPVAAPQPARQPAAAPRQPAAAPAAAPRQPAPAPAPAPVTRSRSSQ